MANSDPLLGQDKADLFLKLSALLTGVEDLDPALGEQYRQGLETKYAIELDGLYALYYQAIREPDAVEVLKRLIGPSANLMLAARQVVSTWYLSQFKDPDPTVKAPILAGHFERGLLWRVIDAHPPAFSARRHGYWTQAPHGDGASPLEPHHD